jgi:hypothetical protein
VTHLEIHVRKLPLVKVHPEKYEYFFTGLHNTKEEIEKYFGEQKSISELKRGMQATKGGKGDDGDAGDNFGW